MLNINRAANAAAAYVKKQPVPGEHASKRNSKNHGKHENMSRTKNERRGKSNNMHETQACKGNEKHQHKSESSLNRMCNNINSDSTLDQNNVESVRKIANIF